MNAETIVALTINPSLDKSTTFTNLIAEQKIRCEKPRYDAGGGGVNVSKAIFKLGGSSTCVLTSGGSTGEMLEELINKEGIESIAIKTKSWTRENFIAFDNSTKSQYRFGFPGNEFSEEENDLISTLTSSQKEVDEEQWDAVIESKHTLLDLNLKELWHYRDLLVLFVRRDFVTVYKQTILGPLWFFIQPILTTITFTIIFGNVAQLSTDGAPKLVFYMAGITLWNYFSTCLTNVSGVFNANASIFGKVYFPRLIMPLTIVISNLMKFGVQFLLFICFVGYYYFQGEIKPNTWIAATPIVIVLMALISMGIGLILSSMTTKYKDLNQLISFGVQLFMYATPVIYPSSSVPLDYQWVVELNPLVGLFDYMRFAYLGVGEFTISDLVYPSIFSVFILAIGVLVFNKTQKTFMDTV